MSSVKIFGAGSIGNHLAHAFRTKGFDVTLTDLDPAALERTKNDIYPSRYGAWDNKIQLKLSKEVDNDPADIVFIGTPPDSHIPIALNVLRNITPKLILLEKPLSSPDLKGIETLVTIAKEKNVQICVGYNHIVSKASLYLNQFLTTDYLGEVQTLSSYTREHWGGIFKAHPWLSGPKDSYLGYYMRGGGALCEHSHGLNMWQHFANAVSAGRIVEVNSTMNFYKDDILSYDNISIATLKTESGLVGDLIQDVVTFPSNKSSRIQGEKAFAELVLSTNNSDIVRLGKFGETTIEKVFNKSRPDDFLWEVEHIQGILDGSLPNNVISMTQGISTMIVIAAIFKSSELKRPVEIDWNQYKYI